MDSELDEGALQYELLIARGEESEALRRARRLRATGEYKDIQQAMRDVDACHARANDLARALRKTRERSQ